jgi:hypothetical protein
MIEFVPATADHIRAVALKMRDRDLAEFSALSYADDREAAAEILASNYADFAGVECALLDGDPVAIGGVIWTRPRVASLLFYATDDYGKVVRPLTRYIRANAMRVAKSYATRIECFSLSTYTEMRQWVEMFGLKPEATLRSYGKNGEDFVVYAWLPEQEQAGKTEPERVLS